jgi:hypothetical protein
VYQGNQGKYLIEKRNLLVERFDERITDLKGKS